MHMRLSEAVDRVRKTSRGVLPDKVGSPCSGADAAPRGIEPVEDIPGKKGAGLIDISPAQMRVFMRREITSSINVKGVDADAAGETRENRAGARP